MTDSSQKWYDNKNNLLLSILFWPVLIYGLYKTSIISKTNKTLLLGGIGFFLVLIYSNIGTTNTQSCNCEVEDAYGRGKIRLQALDYRECKNLYKGEWLPFGKECGNQF